MPDTAVDVLTHRGRVTHICVGKLTIIDSDNGLSPGQRQAIFWTNAGIWLVGPFATNFNGILIGIQIFSLKKMHLKMSSAKWRPFCLGLNVLNCQTIYKWWPGGLCINESSMPLFNNIVVCYAPRQLPYSLQTSDSKCPQFIWSIHGCWISYIPALCGFWMCFIYTLQIIYAHINWCSRHIQF